MGWKTIWSVAKGPNEVKVEQDSATGNMLVKANIVELTPDEATAMAVAMSTAAFPFVKSSRADYHDLNLAHS